MSHGPGRWQRAVLATLEKYEIVCVRDVITETLGEDAPVTRSAEVAVRRAIKRLAEDGTVYAVRLTKCWGCGKFYHQWSANCCGNDSNVLAATRNESIYSLTSGGTALDCDWLHVRPVTAEEQEESAERIREIRRLI